MKKGVKREVSHCLFSVFGIGSKHPFRICFREGHIIEKLSLQPLSGESHNSKFSIKNWGWMIHHVK